TRGEVTCWGALSETQAEPVQPVLHLGGHGGVPERDGLGVQADEIAWPWRAGGERLSDHLGDGLRIAHEREGQPGPQLSSYVGRAVARAGPSGDLCSGVVPDAGPKPAGLDQDHAHPVASDLNPERVAQPLEGVL